MENESDVYSDDAIIELIATENIPALRDALHVRSLTPRDPATPSFLRFAAGGIRSCTMTRFLIEEAGLDPNERDRDNKSIGYRVLEKKAEISDSAGLQVFPLLKSLGYDVHHDVSTGPQDAAPVAAAQHADPAYLNATIPLDLPEIAGHSQAPLNEDWSETLTHAMRAAAQNKNTRVIARIARTGFLSWTGYATMGRQRFFFEDAARLVFTNGLLDTMIDNNPDPPEVVANGKGWSGLLRKLIFEGCWSPEAGLGSQKLDKKDYLRLIDRLLASGARPETVNSFFEHMPLNVPGFAGTIFHIAAKHGLRPDTGLADGGRNLMFETIVKGRVKVFDALVDLGMSPALACPADNAGPSDPGTDTEAKRVYEDPVDLAASNAGPDMAERVQRVMEAQPSPKGMATSPDADFAGKVAPRQGPGAF